MQEDSDRRALEPDQDRQVSLDKSQAARSDEMPRNRLNIDPDSFRGKIYLLVFDKVVLGAVIALALFAYKRWETNDQRVYEDRTTLAFQRATYVKELVPMVVDTQRDMSARSQALIALIETGSVSDKNAIGLAALLLRQGLIRSMYPEQLMWNRDHPLIDVLAKRMPSALEPLLNQYLVGNAPDEKHPIDRRTRSDSDEFWTELFIRAVDQHSDAELAFLDSDAFLDNYLWVMDRLMVRPMDTEAKAWFARGLKGLRILAALRSVGEVGIDQHALGRQYLLTMLSPPRQTRDSLSLAGTVIRLQLERKWASKALASCCLEIVLQEDDDMRTTPDYYHRSLMAGAYIEWYATAKRDVAKTPFAEGDGGDGWDEIQPAVVAGLRGYLSRISTIKIEASDFGPTVKRNSIALPLARILLDGIERGEKPTEPTRQLLTEMASFSDEKLRALLLDGIHLRERASNLRR